MFEMAVFCTKTEEPNATITFF